MCALLLAAGPGQRLRAQAAPAPQGQNVQFQDSINELSVGVGKTILVDTARPITRISLGSAEIAVASPVTPTEVMVNGKAPGETSLIIWDNQGGRQFFNLSVRASNTKITDSIEGLRRELRAELPQQNVRVSIENGTVFLRGTVNDLNSANRAVMIASTAGKVVNLLDVQVPKSDPQILLKVRFASVDRTAEKQLGINFFSNGFGNVQGTVSTGQFSAPQVSPGGATAVTSDLNIFGYLAGRNLGGTLQALETQGLVQVLAEPNVLAVNGQEASILAGGQFPYPVAQANGSGSATITIQFKDYGIRLNFIPTIMPQGTIRLQVAPEVSALDYTHEVQISGFQVPGITSRKVNTEVNLTDGQSFVIGGLLDDSVTQTLEKIPFLSQIPIIGKFFQSIDRTKNNTELIVIVTPEIVAPIPAGQPLPQLAEPVPFMDANSKIPMNNPDAKTAETTLQPAPTTVPMEVLLDSMKPEKALVIEGAGTFGTAGTFGGGGGQSSAPATAGSSSQ